MPSHSAEIYADPENLRLFLINHSEIKISAEIIKKIQLATTFGTVELAVIGGSHFFKLQGYFTELLTCTDEQFPNRQLHLDSEITGNFKFSKRIESFDYQIDISVKNYEKKSDFIEFENLLRKSEADLIHCFEKNTAITALKILENSGILKLKTWHTYPDFSAIVFSETILLGTP